MIKTITIGLFDLMNGFSRKCGEKCRKILRTQELLTSDGPLLFAPYTHNLAQIVDEPSKMHPRLVRVCCPKSLSGLVCVTDVRSVDLEFIEY